MSNTFVLKSPTRESTARRRRLIIFHCFMMITTIGCGRFDGQESDENTVQSLPAISAVRNELGTRNCDVVVARGKLEPAGGVIGITAPPGNRLESLAVAEGDPVKKGQILGEFDGLSARKLERVVAETKLREAKKAFEAREKITTAELRVAEVRLEQANAKVAQAEAELENANQPNGSLGLLEKQIVLAEGKLQQLHEAAEKNLVRENAIDQHQLTVDNLKLELNNARRAAKQKIDAGKSEIEVAKEELVAAKVASEAGRMSTSFDSLECQIQLLDLQVRASEFISPLDGRALAINLRPGEVSTGLPVIQVADTSKMVCRAEVNVADLPRIKVNALARISSPALPDVLAGRVESISQIIGSPRLPSPNPLTQVDWRSAEVVICIELENDVNLAAELINLHVDVAIEAKSLSSDSTHERSETSAGDASEVRTSEDS